MALQRTLTRFGPSTLREATPESNDQSTGTRSSAPVSDDDSAHKLRKRGHASRDGEPPLETRRVTRDSGGEDAGTGLKDLHMPRVVESGNGVVGYVMTKHGSPWESLEKRFSLALNDLVTIASRKDKRLVAVRKFSGPGVERKVGMLQRIRHKNFVALLDCFSFDESCYAIVEHEISDKETLLITLSQFALAGPYPNEFELAAVLGQVSPSQDVQHISNVGPRFWMAWNTSVQ